MRHARLTSLSYFSCTIFVGQEYAPFPASILAVNKCKFLSDRKRFDEELRDYIDLSEDSDIRREQFVPIAEYLQNGDKEFSPRLIDSGTHQRLEKVVLPEEKDQAAQRIAVTYNTAAKIQFGEVQLLCVEKLKVLYPLSPRTLLIVAMIVTRTETWGCDAEDEIQDWLVDHVTEHWWSLAEFEVRNLKKVMGGNEVLSQRVFQKLADNPRAGWEGTDTD